MSTYGPIINGKDFNFFTKVEVNNATFNTNCDVIITFPTQGVLFLIEENADAVEYSFNGTTVHGELDAALPSKGMIFDNRVVSKMWFRLRSGSTGPLTVRIDAWGTR